MNSSDPIPADLTANDCSPTDDGRDVRGRFTAGNRGGPGNPYARRVAHLRSIVLECVTDQDMRDIVNQLVVIARLGDLAAIKLLFQYALGKPAPTVDPDTVDLHELDLLSQAPTPAQFGEVASKHMPPDMVLDAMRLTQQAVGQTFCDQLLDGIRELDERDAAEAPSSDEAAVNPEPTERPQAAPSTNGGATSGQRPDAAPSPNGPMHAAPENGHGRSPNDKRPPSANGAHGGNGRHPDPHPTRR
jgi:hypothetical protein